jgi:tricorn protease
MTLPLALLLAAAIASAPAPAAVTLSEPSLSPDATEIVFVSSGDLWTAPAAGGDAHLLVAHAANETRPLWSPDGTRVAFVSDRTGNGDVYILNLSTANLTRVTYDDAPEQLDGWSRDGEWIYFSSSAQEIAGMNDVYRVRASGGTPMPVANERYTNEFFAAPAPDGKQIALVARGNAFGQWWRHGRSHLDESEIWLLEDADAHRYRKLTALGAKHLWPMWTPDGRTLFYMSDEDGNENLWSIDIATSGSGDLTTGKATKRTSFTRGRLLWPAIANGGAAIVFERDYGIWRYDLQSGEARPLTIALRGAPSAPGIEHVTMSSDFDELAVAPDGKKLAFIARGEVFASATTDPGTARRITNTAAEEMSVAWAPDNRRLVYSSARDGELNLYLFDVASGVEKRLTTSDRPDYGAQFSPDGKSIAFLRNANELHVVDPATGAERLVAKANIDIKPPLQDNRTFVWSPDSKWLAFVSFGERLFRNASVVPAAGGDVRPVTFLGNANASTISWTPDGRSLYFATSQRSEPGSVARVDLVPRVPKFREQQFRELFKEETPKSVPSPADKENRDDKKTDAAPEKATDKKSDKAPVEIVFDDIARRSAMVPVGLDVQSSLISPDGKQLLVVATAAGQDNLYLWPLDELAKEPPVAKQLTSTSGAKASVQWGADSKEIYYLEDGKPMKLTVDGAKSSGVGVSAELDVDFDAEKAVMFAQAWRWMKQNFHDPNLHGVDWNALRAEVEPRVAAAQSREAVRRLLSLMVGELNASHLGVRGPGSAKRTTGRLGLRFDRAEVERNGRFVIREVVGLSPADVTRKIHPGDVLAAVDGVELGRATNLERLLEYKLGKELRLTIAGAGDARRDVTVQPVNLPTEKQLTYRDWVNANRDYVRRASNGRLGYVHMIDMSSESLTQLQSDLDAENQTRDGVLIDIRNNNGGFVNAYALDIFTRRPYLNMTFRDLPTAPARTLLGQRSLERPTVLLTNQHSLSDAEDFSEGYRRLGLGKIVGEPTSGWIIYTSNVTLLDGTIFRIPFITISDDQGRSMELSPRPVDVAVTRPIGESFTGRDSQLDAAVNVLRAK